MAILNAQISIANSENTKFNQFPFIRQFTLSDSGEMLEAFNLPDVDIKITNSGQFILANTDKYFFYVNPRTKKSPLLPETRENQVVVAGKNGSYDFGTEFGNKNFTLDIYSEDGLNNQQMQEQKDFLSTFFNPKRGTRTFADERESGLTRFYRVKLQGNIEPQTFPNWFRFTLNLVATDPYAYEFNEKVITQSSNIVNRGNEDVGVIVIFSGATTTHPYIDYIDDDEPENNVRLEYMANLSIGESVVIDTERLTAVRTTNFGIVQNAMGGISRNAFFRVPANSTKRIEIHSGGGTTSVVIRAKWI